MKERPILFSAPMVRALLDGTKTQTRRVAKADGDYRGADGRRLRCVAGSADLRARCLYGVPGDRLWVKETYFAFGRWEARFSAKKGRDEWRFVDMTIESGFAHAFEAPAGWVQQPRDGATPAWWKRNPLFMPRIASRITLEVAGVRVEQLQDISEADAIAEGLLRSRDGNAWQVDVEGWHYAANSVDSYVSLWESINGAGSWHANPWVWVVEFKLLPLSSWAPCRPPRSQI